MYTWQTSEETLEMVKTQVPVELGVYVLGYLKSAPPFSPAYGICDNDYQKYCHIIDDGIFMESQIETRHASVSVLLFGSCHLISFVSSTNSIQIVRRQCCLIKSPWISDVSVVCRHVIMIIKILSHS